MIVILLSESLLSETLHRALGVPAFGDFSESFRRAFGELLESFRRDCFWRVFRELSESLLSEIFQRAFGEFSEKFQRAFGETAFEERNKIDSCIGK